MSAKLLILCPGQGGQHMGMFDLASSDPAGAALLGELRARDAHAKPPYGMAAAGFDAVAVDAGALFANRTAQPLIVAATLAMWEALRAHAPPPALVAGYSVGELAAWSVAGAVAPLEAVELAQARAVLMDRCLAERPGQALLAVSGLPPPRSGMLAAPCGFHTAIVTGGDSCIIGGPASGQAQAVSRLAAAGAHVTPLPVEIASHTPFMAGAVAPFAAALRASHLHAAETPVLSGISAARLESRGQAVEHLSRQLGEPVVWDECMDACTEAGVTVALELGPGAALARMMQARHPGIACRSVADFRSLDGIRGWLSRHCG
ncbi:malonyl CoA-ACP transacylase [Massilia sp. Root351]|jgi:[acyl-carrier-protein] S-malonyltransferase|uniref:ACP S-malonyltransferase n=1 Tax=Massilia sp. Root351 TaxID=1736522 RepID=UPI00071047F7|nr:acyltransferase domain-containing protein [Massilia sp. Root351]KQV87236.1 malonyl CoA-ACP transacylase [Massilia sp. Root351]